MIMIRVIVAFQWDKGIKKFLLRFDASSVFIAYICVKTISGIWNKIWEVGLSGKQGEIRFLKSYIKARDM